MSLHDRVVLQEGLKYKQAKKAQIPLDSDERKLCLDRKAVWNFNMGPGGVRKPSPAVWKHREKNGRLVYNTNTHRAWNQASTLKGAIKRYHDFVKGTA